MNPIFCNIVQTGYIYTHCCVLVNFEIGFPGVLDVSATYTLSGPQELKLEMEAIPRTKVTPVSLVQHTYWKLAGENSNRTILSNEVRIWANSYTPVDK